jgi:hypothetical protein
LRLIARDHSAIAFRPAAVIADPDEAAFAGEARLQLG